MKKLTQKEQLFCLYYSMLYNAREASANAGYKDPVRASEKLMGRNDIKSAVEKLRKDNAVTPDEIIAGYRRLAFGSCADAVKLLLCGEVPDGDFEALDLFNVSEIKKPKDGAIEIKFFDRLKALEHLEAIQGAVNGDDSAITFYEALLRSAGQQKIDGTESSTSSERRST